VSAAFRPTFGSIIIKCAVVVVEGATVRPLSRRSTMAVIGVIFCVFGLGFLCWLLFTLAVYALPFLAGLTVGLAAFHGGAGVIGAFIVGVLAGVAILAIGQVAVAGARTPLTRISIALVYAIPATIAGYQLSFGFAGIGMPAGTWQQVFAAGGAVLVGLTAFTRMAIVPLPAGRRAPGDDADQSAVALRSHDF